MTGEIIQDPPWLAEIGDVIMTVDGPKICVGRDLCERQKMERLRIPGAGDTTTHWIYHGTSWHWDREKKLMSYIGNWNRYTKRLIKEVRQMTPHPKTGEPCY